MTQKKVDEAMLAVMERLRADVLRGIVRTEGQLERAYGRTLRKLSRRLKATARTRIRREALRELDKLTNEIVPIVERSIAAGASVGTTTAVRQFRELFKDAKPPKFPTDAETLARAQRRIRGTLTVDNVSLSTRMWRNNRDNGLKMARAIQDSLQANETMVKVADRIREVTPGDFRQRIPAHIKDLRDAARKAAVTGQTNHLQRAVTQFNKKIDRLGAARPEFSIQRATREFRDNIVSATKDQIDAHVETYMQERALNHARMIARHETIEAYRDSYVAAQKGKGYVKGIRWELSDAHPEPDECDILASQDLYGLGPGGYPEDGIPDTPHPNDLCFQTSIIDEQHFERIRAKQQGKREPSKPWLSGKTETGAEWLAKQSKEYRERLLGPTRSRIFESNPDAVLTRTGLPRSVKDSIARNQ